MNPIVAALAILLACGPQSQPSWDDIGFAYIGEPAEAGGARWLMGASSTDQKSGRDEILLWPVAGGPATSLGAAPCAPSRLWWLPDGERLLVGCGASFAVIDREGSELLPPQPGTPRDLSADGDRLLLELAVGADMHVAVFDLDDHSMIDFGPGSAPVWRP